MAVISPDTAERIRALIEVCGLEAHYLRRCDVRYPRQGQTSKYEELKEVDQKL